MMLAVVPGTAGALDDYLCYQAAGSRGVPRPATIHDVPVADAFGTGPADVRTPRLVCTPAAEEGLPADPIGHLQGHLIRSRDESPSAAPRRERTIVTRFGTVVASVLAPQRLLVPTALDPSAPVAPLDGRPAFACRRLIVSSITSLPSGVHLVDRFGENLHRLRLPLQLCSAAAGDGLHLLCFAARAGTPLVPQVVRGVHTHTAFGPAVLDRRTVRAVCVPATLDDTTTSTTAQPTTTLASTTSTSTSTSTSQSTTSTSAPPSSTSTSTTTPSTSTSRTTTSSSSTSTSRSTTTSSSTSTSRTTTSSTSTSRTTTTTSSSTSTSRTTTSTTTSTTTTVPPNIRRVPQDYATIQAAVNAARAGDHVVIATGDYTERVLVSGARDGLLIEAADPTHPPTIHGTPNASRDGIRVDSVDRIVIRNLRIVGAYDAIRLNGVHDARISAVHLEDSALGLRVNGGSGTTITGITVVGTRVEQGIEITDAPGTVVADTTVTGSYREGLRAMGSDGVIFERNVVTASRGSHGVRVYDSNAARVRDNRSSGNYAAGFRIDEVDDLVFSGNTATNNGDAGITLSGCPPFTTVADVVAAGNHSSGNEQEEIDVEP